MAPLSQRGWEGACRWATGYRSAPESRSVQPLPSVRRLASRLAFFAGQYIEVPFLDDLWRTVFGGSGSGRSVLILSSTPDVMTMPVAAAALVGRIHVQWGAMTAGGTVAMWPILLFAFLMQRHLVRGLTLGAVK